MTTPAATSKMPPVASWNARSPGKHNLEATAEEVEDIAGEAINISCIQEAARAAARDEDPPQGGHGSGSATRSAHGTQSSECETC